MTDEQIVRALAETVMEWEYLRVGYFGVHDGSDAEETPRQVELEEWLTQNNIIEVGSYFINVSQDFWTSDWDPLKSDADSCAVLDKVVTRQGYDHPGFSWEGPIFKPENRYLTQEGYPLGTTCWYVRLEMDGNIEFVCDADRRRAVAIAALKAKGAWGEGAA
jgi:hypothetical protein